MSDYKVLARKLRPQTFEAVAAQGHVTQTLQNAIRKGRVAQAYLFSGPRGTGKTSTARLLAMALNCEQGPTENPCGACASCEAIRGGRSLDVLEIDGASNRGIDEIRQLREEVGYAAVQGKRKVYIIDEVHMLTNEAFNALLKTLEEPPPHVVFIFATTESHKIPETILSRCQRYNFRRIPAEVIVSQLKDAVAGEALEADELALFQIARKANGAMRDALSFLDQVVSFSEDGITVEAVQDLLGLIPRDLYFDLTQAILERDGAAALKGVENLVEEGGDIGEFADGLLEHFRHLLVACVEGELNDEDLPQADRDRYGEFAGQFQESDLLRMLSAVSELELNLGRVSEPRFWVELTVMKLVQMPSSVDLSELLGRMENLESLLRDSGSRPSPPRAPSLSPKPVRAPEPTKPVVRQQAPPPVEAPPSMEALLSEAVSEPVSQPAPESMVEEPESLPEPAGEVTLEAIGAGWERFVQEVKSKKISVGTFLAQGTPKSLDGGQLLVSFQKNLEFHANQVRRHREMVEGVAAEVFGGSLRMLCEVDYDTGGEDEQVAERSAEDDERVQMVLQIFGGEVVRQGK
ncbi:MAG: DNA polymerase III subunit gamma/tau [bacterium]|nr:DNA polymerase III subunit gamma/tau [bacterium]